MNSAKEENTPELTAYQPEEITEAMFTEIPADAISIIVKESDDIPEWIRQYGSIYHKSKLLDPSGKPTVSVVWTSTLSQEEIKLLTELRLLYNSTTHKIRALIAL